ncbi:bifunctional diaminohydroxyphosphoribosylaminopyrimidine deaminase/5-amino-6-(5-phosphoribosylamino)uracil reductase RibD [bacterium]|nr:bifunctional diaminohydroxyphosphoribosylaminopyrimidine deaminase/5-amino-6-(5-phosphoribosylamino)uracil reductase RibD [bacterium]
MTNKVDTYFMSMALELAEKGRGTTSLNPMVGAVVVKNRSVIGRGYHIKAGSDHAEIIALREAGHDARGAVLYVTMEPCCHHGKTPPCTETIIKSGVRRVVAAMTDDNPIVCGRGLLSLSQAGIKFDVGLLEKQARKLNEAYLKFIRTRLPFVTVKLATTLDGKIADIQGKSAWITGPETRSRVHLWRSWSDAVMVGIGTVLADNPRLNVRHVKGADPLRVVVDSTLRTPESANVLADSNVLIATTERANKTRVGKFRDKGIEVLIIDSSDGRVSFGLLMKKLGERPIMSLLCEGGSTIAATLLRERLADKVIFTIAPRILGSGKEAVGDIAIQSIGQAIELADIEIERIEQDMIITGYPKSRD